MQCSRGAQAHLIPLMFKLQSRSLCDLQKKKKKKCEVQRGCSPCFGLISVIDFDLSLTQIRMSLQMFVSWRADGTNGAALWIYYAARPPPSLPVTLSLSSRLSLFVSFSIWSPYDFLPGRVLSFTRLIPLIPFLPLLSGSFHFQQRVLSISSYSSDVTRGLPLTAPCNTHTLVQLLFCPLLSPPSLLCPAANTLSYLFHVYESD